jgi:hypothetical protein
VDILPDHAFRTGKLAQALDATPSMSWAKNLENGNIASWLGRQPA